MRLRVLKLQQILPEETRQTQRHMDALPRVGALTPNMSEMMCTASLGGTLPQDSNHVSSQNEKAGQNAS